ncbi:hypothetical protein GR702_13215 [Novosphingobium sp. FGD1]|uniref:Uncharacterized protein n=1 Tax=Novosphingobium silvae TaxID=2692619 RepID=A0A7X4K8V6_9SPHN|nr:hypothetical protein [Novosphingobium silvae]MYL98723.1 hypothetical protein [Novosphingobium silvae]
MNGFLSMIPHTLPAWLGAGAAAGGGFGIIKWAFEYVGGRMDKRADRLDADTRFVIDQLRAELARVSGRLDRAEGEILDLREQLAECQHKHAEAEAKVMQLEARQQGYSEARDRAQTILAAERIADRAKRET